MDFELKECQKYRPDHTMYLLISIDANPAFTQLTIQIKKKQCDILNVETIKFP